MVRVGYCSNGFFYISAKKLYGCNSIDLFFLSFLFFLFFKLSFFSSFDVSSFLRFGPLSLSPSSLILVLGYPITSKSLGWEEKRRKKEEKRVPLSPFPVTVFSFDFFSFFFFVRGGFHSHNGSSCVMDLGRKKKKEKISWEKPIVCCKKWKNQKRRI